MQTRTFDRFCTVNAMWIGVAVLFAPMVAIYLYQNEVIAARGGHAEEATVGIAVILRATARRFMRSASSGIMRSTVGALGRASARTATRRVVKAATRVVVTSAIKADLPRDEDIVAESQEQGRGRVLVSVAIGTLALMVSFWGVLQIASEGTVRAVLRDGQIGPLQAAMLAGVPLVAYVGLHAVFGRLCGVVITYKTELDGLLLQGYFTGAGSFLPMTTDVDYAGTDRAKSNVAAFSLLSMLAIHIVLVFVGEALDADGLEFCGSMFLIYAFIYVFPIAPLEGKFIWLRSRWLWLAVAVPILAAFVGLMPAEFGEIL